MAAETNKEKLYINSCVINSAIKYSWNRQINRDGGNSKNRTENNNALIKCPPVFLADIQAKDSDLISDRAVKIYICKSLGIDFKETYMYYGFTELKPATAKADTTSATAKQWINKLRSALKNAQKKKVYPTSDEVIAQIEKLVPAEHREAVKEDIISDYKPKQSDFSFE